MQLIKTALRRLIRGRIVGKLRHAVGTWLTGGTPGGRLAGEISPHAEIIQLFRPGRSHLSSISVPLAVLGRRRASRLSFSLFKVSGVLPSSKALEPVLHQLEKCAELVDGEVLDLYFSPQEDSAGSLYVLKIQSADGSAGNAAAVRFEAGGKRIEGHVACVFGSQDPQQTVGVSAVLGYSPPGPYTPLPERLVYSPVSQCNLNCVHCISAATRSAVKRLPESARQEIRTGCRRGLIKYIVTDYSGDILWADHRFGGELDYLIDLAVPFHVDTNGTHLTEERSKKLLDSRLQWLNVSLDAATTNSYNRVRRGSPPLESVIRNVARFAVLREGRPGPRIALSLGFTLMRSNLDELNDFIRLAHRNGVEIVVCRHIEAYSPEMVDESLIFHKERFNEARLVALELAAALGVKMGIPDPFPQRPSRLGHTPCLSPWTQAIILGNGDVQVCCVPKTKIGNLHEQSLEQMWKGEAYAAFRTALNSDKPPSVCTVCPYSRRPGN
ncbi:MAG: SPASM domain-containing protein, partial [Myxococcaceae bacterium]